MTDMPYSLMYVFRKLAAPADLSACEKFSIFRDENDVPFRVSIYLSTKFHQNWLGSLALTQQTYTLSWMDSLQIIELQLKNSFWERRSLVVWGNFEFKLIFK